MFDLAKLWIEIRYALKRGKKSERLAWREAAREELIEKRLKESRWGVSYSVFDGEELLEASIRAIRGEVDYINVVHQPVSWYGKPASPELAPFLESLLKQGLIDELIEFRPDLKLKARVNERRKRDLGLKKARERGCDYFMSMDCDEFYVAGQVAATKRKIIKRGLSHSYCPIVVYGEKPTLRPSAPPEGMGFVPFFAKLGPRSKMKITRRHICETDPTRCVAAGFFSRQQIMATVVMHHFSLVRKNLPEKFDNSSGKHKEYATPPSRYDESNCHTVKNYFGIDV